MKSIILREINKIVREAKADKTPTLPFSFWGGLKRSKGKLIYKK